jgi:hypothetical protein
MIKNWRYLNLSKVLSCLNFVIPHADLLPVQPRKKDNIIFELLQAVLILMDQSRWIDEFNVLLLIPGITMCRYIARLPRQERLPFKHYSDEMQDTSYC